MHLMHLMRFRLALIVSGTGLAGCATPTVGPPGCIAMPRATAGDARGGRSVSVPPLPERALFADGSLQPWSAVFASCLMKTAGVGSELFPQHEGHRTCTRAILDAPSANGCEALDAAANAPAVDDVLCAPRDAAAARFTNFAALSALTRQLRNHLR